MKSCRLTLTSPREDTVIWRYIDFAKFASLVTSRSLFFANPVLFDDRWEGWHPVLGQFNDDKPETLERLARMATIQLTGAREKVFVNCWHMSPEENYPMWKAYAASGQGIAIQSTIGALRQSFERQDVTIAKVRYLPRDATIKSATLTSQNQVHFKMFAAKQEEFASEREVRAMVRDPDEKRDAGLFVKVDLAELLHSVVIAPGLWPQWSETVRALLTQAGVDDKIVRKSRLDDDHPFQTLHAHFSEVKRDEEAVKRLQKFCHEELEASYDVSMIIHQCFRAVATAGRFQPTTQKRIRRSYRDTIYEHVISAAKTINSNGWIESPPYD